MKPKTIARLIGLLFIVGTVAGISSVLLSEPVLDDTHILVKTAENENGIVFASLCVLIMGFSLALIPILFYPLAKKYNQTLAIGYVVFRGCLETVIYIALAVSLFLLVPFSQVLLENESANIQTAGDLILKVHNNLSNMLVLVFSLGAIMLYYLLYSAKLVPRWLSIWGLFAITLHLITGFLLIFDGAEADSSLLVMMNFPIFLQEMVMAGWLIVKGFDLREKG